MRLKKLVVELTSLCNLDCEYCFKEPGTSHLSIDLLKRILQECRIWGASKITYTGGEPSLYPSLSEALQMTVELGYKYSIVTNGWQFSRIFPLLDHTRQALKHVFFSLDSAIETLHDEVRGAGSFLRVKAAAELCRVHGLPFSFLVVINRKNFHEMEQLSLLAVRMGAASLRFGHLLPTSKELDRRLSLSCQERRAVEAEVQRLDSLLEIGVSFAASAGNNVPGPCCEPLAGQAVSIDSHGRLSLCCQLAGYRGAANETDLVADLHMTDFATAYAGFLARGVAQTRRRDMALASGVALAEHPCDFCISVTEKTDWNRDQL
jgi:MoaA/NifB/PqqE/SkfB family radical SAM enzyme